MAPQNQNIDHSEIKNSNVQLVQAGRDAVSFNNSPGNQVVIENTFLRLFGRPESNHVDWNRARSLLQKKQLPEIRKRLTDTLGRERILMDVSIAEQQQWVNRLQADRQLQVNGENSGLLAPNKLLIETFGRDDIAGKLLILGAPGSGKTTALLSLAEQLVIGAINQPQTVIPVIFELSTWREDSQSIEDWIIEQLYDLDGGNRKRKIYEQWLEEQVLLPLLDGLDELGLERQKKCTEKLNKFARTYPQLVVCCRVREFETANIKLSKLNGAICLRELSDGQIENYFQSINRADLWLEMKTKSGLQEFLQETAEGEPGLLRVPLFIKLLSDVYDPQEPIKNKADLLEKYVEYQLSFDKRERDRHNGLDNYKWSYKKIILEPKLHQCFSILSWISRQIIKYKGTDFLVTDINSQWIENLNAVKFYHFVYKSILIIFIVFSIFAVIELNLLRYLLIILYNLTIYFLFLGILITTICEIVFLKQFRLILFAFFLGLTITINWTIVRFCLEYLENIVSRLVLWQSGIIPWNFARFLNYCVERRLLLRVGGRYRFLHRELLDHFAQLPPGTQIK